MTEDRGLLHSSSLRGPEAPLTASKRLPPHVAELTMALILHELNREPPILSRETTTPLLLRRPPRAYHEFNGQQYPELHT